MRPCPSREVLRQFLKGGTTRWEFEPLESHIEHCIACQGSLDELTCPDNFAWLLPDVDPPDPSEASRDRPRVPGYTIVGEGLVGGHGVVYQAVDEALGRTVAIKVLRDGTYADANARARLLAEARAIASLSHPNIVSLFTVAQVGTGIETRPALVLEWVPGGSLAARLDRRPQPGRTAAAMVGALARAVEEAHRSGVLHRDIKPGNILLPGAGFEDPKLGDFGLAKVREDGVEWAAHSTVIGTPAYMAPELVGGAQQSTGPHADIYALGVVLYELLTGRPPFQAETPFETFLLSRDHDPEQPRSRHPGLSRDLETICLKCLEKMPDRRYATAGELGEDLGRFLDGEPVRARPVGPLGRLARWGGRNPATAVLSSLLFVGMAAGLVIATTLWRIAERRRAEVTTHLEEVERSRGELRDILVAHTPLAKRLLRSGGDTSEADIALFDRVVALALRGMEMPGGDLDARHDAAFATLEVANILQDRGDWGRAEAVCVKATARLNQLALDHPDRRDFVLHYAQGCIQLSAIAKNTGRLDEELAHLREANQIGEDLVARYPGKYGLVESLAAFRTSLARAYELRGDLGRAEQGFAGACDDLRRLVKEHPEAENGIVYYVNAMRLYAWFLLERRGQFDRYFSSRQEFFETAEGLKLPGLADYTNRRIPIAFDYLDMARVLARLERHDDAGRYARRALQLSRDIAEDPTSNKIYENNFAGCAFEVGLMLHQDDPSAASALFRESIGHLERVVFDTNSPVLRAALAELRACCPDDAVRDVSQALAEARHSLQLRPEDERIRRSLFVCLYESGRYDEALAALDGMTWPIGGWSRMDDDAAGIAKIYRAMILWQVGRRDEAREQFRNESKILHRSWRSSCRVWLAHDQAWRLIEQIGPPPRSSAVPTNSAR